MAAFRTWGALGFAAVVLVAQGTSDQELARLIADVKTRRAAVDGLLAAGNDKVPERRTWREIPPDGTNEFNLLVSLADAFGELKTTQAIPFLIKNISLRRYRFIDFAPWLKVPETIEQTFPAVAALINIGPDASRSVMRAYSESTLVDEEDRLAAVFVVSRTRGLPEANAFLRSVIANSSSRAERPRAEAGLKYLSEKPK